MGRENALKNLAEVVLFTRDCDDGRDEERDAQFDLRVGQGFLTLGI